MSVYVDGMQRYDHAPKVRGRSVAWCHMMADTEAELLEMATQLGLKLKWREQFDSLIGDHFPLTSKQRERAINLGAKPVTSRELVALRQKARVVTQVLEHGKPGLPAETGFVVDDEGVVGRRVVSKP